MSDGIFARRLGELRKAAGLTQLQLAAAMTGAGNTMHRSAVAKIEAGDRSVSVGEALQLAAVLGVGLRELVTESTSDTEREHEHRKRVEAQLAVRHAQNLAAERLRLLDEAQILYDNAVARVEASVKRLAELGGEMPSEPPAGVPTVIERLAAASRPRTPGKKDDQ